MMRQLIAKAAVIGLVLSTMACGNAMKATGIGDGLGGLSVDTNQIQKVEQATTQAETSMQQAQLALDEVVKNGKVNVPGEVTVSSEFGAQSLTGIAEKLQTALNKIYDKITLPVQKAKDAINQARAQIAAAIAKLDPNDAQQASMIAKLQEMLTKLDAMESRLAGVYGQLASKIDLLIGKVDELIAKVPTGNPLMIVVLFELQEVRRVIVEFRDKLAAT